MEPVVNELEKTYQERIEFRRLEATGEGKAAFQAYHLSGHPSFVLLDPSGEVRWTGMGQQTRKTMVSALDSELEEP